MKWISAAAAAGGGGGGGEWSGEHSNADLRICGFAGGGGGRGAGGVGGVGGGRSAFPSAGSRLACNPLRLPLGRYSAFVFDRMGFDFVMVFLAAHIDRCGVDNRPITFHNGQLAAIFRLRAPLTTGGGD